MTIVIIGAGIAGAAAAWRAHQIDTSIVMVDEGMGASDLTSGAVDDVPWERRVIDAPSHTREPERAFCAELGLWTLSHTSAIVATGAGTLRPAAGFDRSVLDVSQLAPGSTVGVADVPHRGWDARTLASALDAEPLARRRAIKFVPTPTAFLHRDDERLFPDVDLASEHDALDRIAWLAERVRESRAQTPFDALLVGSWLGVRKPCAEEVSKLSGVSVGEVLSPPGGAAGYRLRTAIDALISRRKINVMRGHARVSRAGAAWRVEVTNASKPGESSAIEATAIVFAVGGVGSGGIALLRTDPTRIEAPSPRFIFPAYRGAILAHDPQGTDGEWTMSTRDPNLRWSPESPGTIERVGLTHDHARVLDDQGMPQPGLFGAGDALASRPRTVLEAVRAGIAAGALAASSR